MPHSNHEKDFHDMVQRERDLIWRLCARFRLSAAWTTEDLFQEAVVALWHAWPTYGGRSSESTWAYSVVAHRILMLLRRTSNRPQPEVATSTETASNDSGDAQLLLELVHQLPHPDGLIVSATLDGYTHREVAQMVGLTPMAVAMRLMRAKRVLKQQFLNEINPSL